MEKLILADFGNIRGITVRYLSSYARKFGITTKLLFPLISNPGFNNPPRLTEIQKKMVFKFLRQQQATHLGCYLMTGHFRAFHDLVIYLRSSGWNGCIIAGGVHPTVRPEENLFEGVDYAVVGPGEKPLVDIIKNKPLDKISGLVYKANGGIKINEIQSDAIIDLDLLPFPDYEFKDHFLIRHTAIEPLSVSLYCKLSGWSGRYYYLTTTRGCPYRCSYCCNVDRHKLRRASVNRVIEELHYAKERMPFICGVNIQDDSFFMGSDEWLEEFSRKYKKDFGWPFIARIMPRFAAKARINMLKSCGLRYVSIGLQGSDRLNSEVYNRRETNESFLNACHAIAEAGIFFVVDVILDVVYETEDDLREIARTLNKLPRPFKVLAYGMTPFPGSDFYKLVVRDGLLEKFGADAYESMFKATRPGAYKTPLYWRILIQRIIPLYRNKLVDYLIESGPHEKEAVRKMKRLYRRSVLKMVIAEWLRHNFPGSFTRAIVAYNFFSRSFHARKYKKNEHTFS